MRARLRWRCRSSPNGSPPSGPTWPSRCGSPPWWPSSRCRTRPSRRRCSRPSGMDAWATADDIAQAVAADRASGRPLGPLAGVPFAVKNLFDVAGLATLAGSKINRERPPATADATLVARLEAAGAVLVGALNMGEYAYDFTGENAHDGPSRNPHDLA